MWRRLTRSVRPDLAVDLGSARCRVAVAGDRSPVPRLIDEPTVVAVARGGRRVLGRGAAVGRLAHQMLGRTPAGVDAVRPIVGGVVADFDLAEALMAVLIDKARRGRRGPRSRVLLTVADGLTPVERRAAVGVLERAGAGSVRLLDSARAAALGAGLPVSEPVASLICTVGAATCEVAVLSLGDRIAGRSVRTGGDDWAVAVRDHLRAVHGLKIGDETAARVVHEVGSAARVADEETTQVSGLDVAGRVPRTVAVTSEEIRDALADPLEKIVTAIAEAVEDCGTELVADLARGGLTLCGGGANLRGLDRCLSERLNLPVRVASNPGAAAVRGAVTVLENRDVWRHWLAPAARAA
ncbi:rod shape-determining protein [Alienimonas chondri]|uniref:Cell shape-determining protein MreB n=1 Tax=Alienimonas chondri TaxID=2681879 RepID=A0ABX1VE93_9PLAN|nr:rod shape-determining protein [Alienimonas chondri]NNJ26428.1 Rod shape-determining protein MreB [Alienimonas chondri]